MYALSGDYLGHCQISMIERYYDAFLLTINYFFKKAPS